MRRFVPILICACLAGVGVGLLYWHGKIDEVDSKPLSIELTPDRKKAFKDEETITDEEKQYFELVTPEEDALRPEGVSRGAWAYAMAELRVKGKMNGQVVFFGKVVDGSGEPLAGVSVDAELIYYETSLPKMLKSGEKMPEKTLELVSDHNGRFSIIEPTGSELTLLYFRKEGYRISGRTYFGYSFGSDKAKDAHVGNPESPEVFTMEQVQ